MTRGRFAAGSLLAMLPFVAAGPSPTPNLNALSTVLAGAPDGSWVEARPASDTLEGTFGATFYVTTQWNEQSTRDDIRQALVSDGFIGGYGRTFDRAAPDGHIIEDVKAFPDAAHAMTNWQWDQNYFHDATDTANVVATPAIPNSFGDRYLNNSWHGIDIYFTKANYVFTVTLGSTSDYLTETAVAQSNAVYNQAPDHDVLSTSTQPGLGSIASRSTLMIVGGSFLFGIVVLSVGAFVYIAYRNRRRTMPGPYAALSPDGNYWWDGTSWQPVVRR